MTRNFFPSQQRASAKGLTENIALNGDRFPRRWERHKIYSVTNSNQNQTRSSIQCHKARKEKTLGLKRKNKLSLFTGDMYVYVENLKESIIIRNNK